MSDKKPKKKVRHPNYVLVVLITILILLFSSAIFVYHEGNRRDAEVQMKKLVQEKELKQKELLLNCVNKRIEEYEKSKTARASESVGSWASIWDASDFVEDYEKECRKILNLE